MARPIQRYPLLRPIRFATWVVLSAMVFQLGACPCGCVEHNAWVQLITSVFGHDHHDLALADGDWNLDADDHDCSGEPDSGYIDNARLLQFSGSLRPDTTVLFTGNVSAIVKSASPGGQPGQWTRCRVGAHAPSRTALQVFHL